MLEFWNSLGTNHQITIVLGIIGWFIAIWQSVVAFKHKKDSVVFENRLQIYNDYFQKIDDINERLMIDFQEYIGPTITNFFSQILQNPDSSDQLLIDLQKATSEVTIKATNTISQSEQELQKLRFIASEKTLSILDKYRALAKSQIDLLSEVFGTIDIQKSQNFDASQNQKLVDVGQNLIETKNKLEIQMRKDLGIK